jgi:hypothetical protein
MRDEVQDTEGKAEIGDLVGTLGIERQSVCKPRRGDPVDDLSEDLLEVVGELRARLVRVVPLPSQVAEFRGAPRSSRTHDQMAPLLMLNPIAVTNGPCRSRVCAAPFAGSCLVQ